MTDQETYGLDESTSAADEIAYQDAIDEERRRVDAAADEYARSGGEVVEDRPLTGVGELYVDCPHCGKRALVNARAYQIDKLECNVLADKDNPDEPAWLDWDTALIEADFTYECAACGGHIADRMQELDDMRAAGTYNISTEEEKCSG